ncbi:sulfurtransferase [Arthrobacter cryoconiti]|uniref:Sulfurtransferase n=1 Tax=Arthrobacter cryoconiti TaxID=748907 RepID=A0ABV8QVW4_9MICC|nr:sulfurtransferase [Arthrobacter cryoconiti]MCC9068957.1 sulfurtransferase [Arthrobacter cryoconiti]
MAVIISVDQLQGLLSRGGNTVLLDVRWALGDPHGHAHYQKGHLPGAIFVDMNEELAGHGEPGEGRHPLPTQEAFGQTVRRWGINSGDTVVAYDDAGLAAAARAWWLLGYAGVPDVFLLDGGLAAWRAANLPLETGEERAEPGNAVVRYGAKPALDIVQAGEWAAHGILLDARAGERYRGEREPIDPRAGHIPGALSAPTSENLSTDSTFLPAAALRSRFAALGITEGSDVAVYCGSGVTAAHEIAALEIAGFRAALFPGSWSAWSNHPELPLETGNGDTVEL